MGKGRRLRALRAIRAKAAREAYVQAEEGRAIAAMEAERRRQEDSARAKETGRLLMNSRYFPGWL